MEEFIYAQIDLVTGKCTGVSQLCGIVDAPHMIRLAVYDSSLCGKIWNGSEWLDPPPPPEPPTEPDPVPAN